ncbi:MAG: ABC transporter transmembrane domain-containing protein [Eubacterium ramulus]
MRQCRNSRNAGEEVDDVNLVSREILTGLSVIRAFRREDKEEERFDGVNRELTKTMLLLTVL